MFAGLLIFSIVSNIGAKRISKGREMKPEDHLPLMILGAFCILIGLVIYGWTAQYHVFWFVPIFGSAFVGIGLISTFVSAKPPFIVSGTDCCRCPFRHIWWILSLSTRRQLLQQTRYYARSLELCCLWLCLHFTRIVG